ncbi:MAG: glycoside hydrolase [Clostridia bacterium]|nr:glycoside hydrolase [Clostridia bacterium]
MIRIISPAAPVWTNPLPQLKSRQCLFPSLVQLPSGRLVASYTIGEAMESVDCLTYLSHSDDLGKTWSAPKAVFPAFAAIPRSETLKLTVDGDTLLALGYAFDRPDPALPLGNPETGGLLDDFIFCAASEDGGETWSAYREIPCAWGHHAEASAPITVLQDGSWATPITGFMDWEGKPHGKNCGRLLRSFDKGVTWNDDTVCMAFPNDRVTCFEQRICQLTDGTIVDVGWNEDLDSGNLMDNHLCLSSDNGKTFTAPIPSGIRGQATGIIALSDNRFMTLHCLRRDTDRPGILAVIFQCKDGEVTELGRDYIWEPDLPVMRDNSMAAVFAFLKFGQPSAVKLADGTYMMIHWAVENGSYKVFTTRFALEV